MANTLQLEIVTPEARTFSDTVEMVTLPGIEGEMGVYPQHVPLMTQLVPGEIIIRKDGQDSYLAVGDGFVEITGEKVSILAEMAINSDQIDEGKAEEARQRAEARLAQNPDEDETAIVTAALANSIAQIQVRRRHPRQ